MPPIRPDDLRHVRHLWDDVHAATLDPVERLVYRSNLLGADGRVTNTGGGNTSSKLVETDVFSGRPVEVLWVKGSGGRAELKPPRPSDVVLLVDTAMATDPDFGVWLHLAAATGARRGGRTFPRFTRTVCGPCKTFTPGRRTAA